eukprot:331027-Chlamydomonas_euryale.AAC.4
MLNSVSASQQLGAWEAYSAWAPPPKKCAFLTIGSSLQACGFCQQLNTWNTAYVPRPPALMKPACRCALAAVFISSLGLHWFNDLPVRGDKCGRCGPVWCGWTTCESGDARRGVAVCSVDGRPGKQR